MKILYLVNELQNSCGVSNQLFYFLSEFIKRGEYKIEIICGGGDSIDRFRNLGINVVVNKNINHANRSILSYFNACIQLLIFIRKNKIELVHSHHHYAANIVQTIKLFCKIQTVMTNHGLLPEVGLLNHFPADYIIAVNDHVYKYLMEKSKRFEKKVRLIYHGIPIHNFKKYSYEKIRIIAASRLVKDKGLDVYIKAVSRIPENDRTKAEFFLAGKGEEEEGLLKLILELNAPITFLGEITNLQKKFEEMDIFIIPTRSRTEGFPLTLIEAARGQNLVITSSFLGVHSIFSANVDGLVFEIDDDLALSQLIVFAINNYNELNKMRLNFYHKSLNLFDIEKMIQKTVDIYHLKK